MGSIFKNSRAAPAACGLILAVFLCSCRSDPVLPGQPEYVKKSARNTARLATAPDGEERMEAILMLLDEKVEEMCSLAHSPGPLLEALGSSYGLLLTQGLCREIQRSGVDPQGPAARRLDSALTDQIDILEDGIETPGGKILYKAAEQARGVLNRWKIKNKFPCPPR